MGEQKKIIIIKCFKTSFYYCYTKTTIIKPDFISPSAVN